MIPTTLRDDRRVFRPYPARASLVNEELLTSFRRGERAAIERLYGACSAYVRGVFGHRLDREDVREIVSDAVVDSWSAVATGPTSTAARVLQTSLERRRKRMMREKSRFVGKLDEEAASAPQSVESDLDSIRIVRLIEGYMVRALGHLGARDYDLLVEFYRLDSVGIPPRGRNVPSFDTDAARRQALRRARLRFSEALERLLAEAARDHPTNGRGLEHQLVVAAREDRLDGWVLREALEVVRGARS